MELTLILIFIIGYSAITFEHTNAGRNKRNVVDDCRCDS